MSLLTKCTNAYNLDNSSIDSVAGNNGVDTSITYSGTFATLNGSTSKILIADSPSFTFGSSDFSIGVWVKKAANGTAMSFLGQSDSGASIASSSIVLEFFSNNRLYANIFYGGSYFQLINPAATTNFNWHFVLLERVGNVFNLYLDNVLVSTATLAITINNSSNKMVIGQYGESPIRPWNGSIGGVYFFKGFSLTSTERTKLYNSGSFLKYPFGESNGNMFLMF